MDSEEADNGEMDSLFEGMILFGPSQVAEADDSLHHQPPEGRPQPPEEPQRPSTSSDHPPSADTSSSSQPLDENLFSDLSLITPSSLNDFSQAQPQPDPRPSAAFPSPQSATTTSNRKNQTASSISRQSSTRKKKRAGLRVGYGRDASVPDEPQFDGGSVQPELPPSLAIAATTIDIQLPEGRNSPRELESSTADGDFRIIDDSAVLASEDAQSEAEVLSKDHDLQEKGKKLNSEAPQVEGKSEQTTVQISKKLRHVKELVASVSATRKECTRRRRKAAEALSVASEKHMELEKELEEACEAEDFEMAERVSDSFASAEKVKEEMAAGLRQAEAECDAVESKMLEVLQCQIAAEEECAALLKDLAQVSVL